MTEQLTPGFVIIPAEKNCFQKLGAKQQQLPMPQVVLRRHASTHSENPILTMKSFLVLMSQIWSSTSPNGLMRQHFHNDVSLFIINSINIGLNIVTSRSFQCTTVNVHLIYCCGSSSDDSTEQEMMGWQ